MGEEAVGIREENAFM